MESPRKELKRLEDSYYLTVQGGVTYILDKNARDKVVESMSDKDCRIIAVQGNILNVRSIIGIFTYDKYINSKMVSGDIERMIKELKSDIEYENTSNLIRR